MDIASIALSLSSSISSHSVHLPFFSSSSTFLKKARIRTTRTRSKQSNKGVTCNALFGLGVPELVVIAGVAALIFGPKNLPQVGRSIGKTVKSFQRAAKEFESDLKKQPSSVEEAEAPAEKSIAASEQETQDIKISSSRERVFDL